MIKQNHKILIFGAGETAELALEYFTHDSPHEVVAFTVDGEYLKENSFNKLPVIPFEEISKSYSIDEHSCFVALSSDRLNRGRMQKYSEVKKKGFQLASYISTKAFVWRTAQFGENCFILENNVIQHGVTIGNNVTLWSGNHIGHRSKISDHTFISSQVVVSGFCEIGEACFVGVNSTLADHVKIASDCLIGAGTVVTKDVNEGIILRGNPAEASGVGTHRYFRLKE